MEHYSPKRRGRNRNLAHPQVVALTVARTDCRGLVPRRTGRMRFANRRAAAENSVDPSMWVGARRSEGHPSRRGGMGTPNPRLQIPHSRPQIPDLTFQIANPRFQTPDCKSQIPDARFQSPDSRRQMNSGFLSAALPRLVSAFASIRVFRGSGASLLR